MRIMVTGKEGQLARSLAERAPHHPNISLMFAARPEVDLAVPGKLASAVEQIRPDLVINAAAYTAVDAAEKDEALAQRINAEAAGEGAEAAARIGATFMQLSTDYVFNGDSTEAWSEGDVVDPINAYGRTKAEGERRVLAADARHIVVRTSWLLGPFGHNFLKTMLRLASERDEIAVVDDQWGCPTMTLDLADALLVLAGEVVSGEARGIIHLANSGKATWATLAQEIFVASAARGGPSATVRRITSADYPTPARRPLNSVLNCITAQARYGVSLRDWRESLGHVVSRLVVGCHE